MPNSPDKCYLCPASRDCLNLHMAYRILDNQIPPTDLKAKRAYDDLLKQLAPYYPCGDICPIETDANVRDLINKAIKYIRRYGLK